MKTSRLVSLFVAAAFAAVAAFAAEKEKEVTLTGMGQCAKCSLSKTASCQNAIVVKQDGKDVTYLLTENDVSKKFHDEICEAAKEIRVVGVVKDTKGEKEIVASKIELVKKAAG
jgi:hypothetical protein